MAGESGDLRRVERRIAAVSAVDQVVHAVWALARAQLPRAERAVAESSAYLDWVEDIVDRLAGPEEDSHGDRALVVLLGPERAFCGSLPRRILAQAPRGVPIGLVGRRLGETAWTVPSLRARAAFTVAGAASADELDDVARTIAHEVLRAAGRARVDLMWPAGAADVMRLGVLLASRRVPSASPPQTYTAVPTVLAAAVGEAVVGRLDCAVAETLLAEVRARAAAAENARRACERRLEALRCEARVRRQEEVTNEVLEVVAGHRASGGAEASGLRRGR